MLSVIEITSRPPMVRPLMADWKEQEEQEDGMDQRQCPGVSRQGSKRDGGGEALALTPTIQSPPRGFLLTPPPGLSAAQVPSPTCHAPPCTLQSKDKDNCKPQHILSIMLL